MNKEKLEQFERAFGDSMSSIRIDCGCGGIYYCDDDNAEDWEDDEIEMLRTSFPNNGRDYMIGYLTIMGKTYADACDYWHPKAENAMGFVENHWHKIAQYTDAERERLLKDASAVPSIKPISTYKEVKVGTRIRFLKELSQGPTEDMPACMFAPEDGTGVIVEIGGCWEGYWAKWDDWPHPFGIERKNFEVIST